MTPVGQMTGAPGGVSLGVAAAGQEAQAAAVRIAMLADVVLASTNRIVTSTNMIVGAYTIANPSSADLLARNVTVTATQVGGVNDTPGTIIVTGTNINGDTITETITPVQGSTVAGLKAFKTVTGVVGAGWVINTGNDTIVVGFGTCVGLPFKLNAAADVMFAVLGTAIVAATVVAGGVNGFESSTIDTSAATYDAAKDLMVVARA